MGGDSFHGCILGCTPWEKSTVVGVSIRLRDIAMAHVGWVGVPLGETRGMRRCGGNEYVGVRPASGGTGVGSSRIF